MSSHMHLCFTIYNNPQIQGHGIHLWNLKVLVTYWGVPKPYQPSSHPLEYHKAWRITQDISLTPQTQLRWWAPFEEASRFIWSPKYQTLVLDPSLACISHGSPWILSMPLRTPQNPKIVHTPYLASKFDPCISNPNPSGFGSWQNLWLKKP